MTAKLAALEHRVLALSGANDRARNGDLLLRATIAASTGRKRARMAATKASQVVGGVASPRYHCDADSLRYAAANFSLAAGSTMS